jgi:hypothetical protein
MAWILESFIVNPGDDAVMMSHRFFGETQAECRSTFNEHVSHCEYFKAAHADGRTQEEWSEIDEDELPVAEKTK